MLVRGVGGLQPILGEGDIHSIWTNPEEKETKVILTKVTHVEGIQVNLLSIKALDQKGSTAVFSQGLALITAPGSWVPILTRVMSPGGLYLMNIKTIPGDQSTWRM